LRPEFNKPKITFFYIDYNRNSAKALTQKMPRKAGTVRTRTYCVTINNYKDDDLELLKNLDFIRYGVFGKEVGESGTPHLQGYLQLKAPNTTKWLQKKLQKAGVSGCTLLHANGTPEENKTYCSKDGDFTEWGEMKTERGRTDIKKLLEMTASGAKNAELREECPVAYMRYYKAVDRVRRDIKEERAEEKLMEEYEGCELRDWQEKAVKRLLEQDDRKVLWYVDEVGNSGKSWLAKYIAAKLDGFYVSGGKTADIAYAYQYQELVVFDFTRTQEETVNYSAIEAFKNGMVFSPKYESGMKKCTGVKIICFSNWHPDTTKLSEDRWDIVNLVKPASGFKRKRSEAAATDFIIE